MHGTVLHRARARAYSPRSSPCDAKVGAAGASPGRDEGTGGVQKPPRDAVDKKESGVAPVEEQGKVSGVAPVVRT
jgi:hypothetical protein